MKKNSFYKLLILIVITSFSYSSFAEPIKIKFSHAAKENTPKGKMVLHFKRLIKERIGDDKAIVEIYPNNNLYNDNESIKALIKGDIQLIAPATSKLTPYASRLQVLDLPFLFVNDDAAKNFLGSDYGQRMLRLLGNKGLIGLGYLHGGMKQMSTSSPIKNPSDLNGLRFHIMNSNIIESQFKTLEAITSRMDSNKIYSLLENKKIDGQESTWSNIYSQKTYQYQPYILESNHGYIGYMLLSNAAFWGRLPSDIKPIIERSLYDAIDHGNQIVEEQATLNREQIIANQSAQVYTLNEEERATWINAIKPVWQQYENTIGSELINIAAASR